MVRFESASIPIMTGQIRGSIPLKGSPPPDAMRVLKALRHRKLELEPFGPTNYKWRLVPRIVHKGEPLASPVFTYLPTDDRWARVPKELIAHGLRQLINPTEIYEDPFDPDAKQKRDAFHALAGFFCRQRNCPMMALPGDVAQLDSESRFLRSYFKYWLGAKDKSRLLAVLNAREGRIARLKKAADTLDARNGAA